MPAGTVAVVHFDIYHRGSRRLQSAHEDGRKRVMYKFWLSRTRDPDAVRSFPPSSRPVAALFHRAHHTNAMRF